MQQQTIIFRRPQEIIIFHLGIRCLTPLVTEDNSVFKKTLYSGSNSCQKWDKVFWLPKYLPPSRLAPTRLQQSVVITRVAQAEPEHQANIGMMVWWEPVGLESNFEVCSPFPCKLLHLVELLLLLDGQVDLLVGVHIQVEQVQLPLLVKGQE